MFVYTLFFFWFVKETFSFDLTTFEYGKLFSLTNSMNDPTEVVSSLPWSLKMIYLLTCNHVEVLLWNNPQTVAVRMPKSSSIQSAFKTTTTIFTFVQFQRIKFLIFYSSACQLLSEMSFCSLKHWRGMGKTKICITFSKEHAWTSSNEVSSNGASLTTHFWTLHLKPIFHIPFMYAFLVLHFVFQEKKFSPLT